MESVLVLSGGNALGCYHSGAWEALSEADLVPGWIVGASIGAVTAAIIAGNPPARRVDALHQFWQQAASFDPLSPLLPPLLRTPFQYSQALASRLFGRPPLFNLRPPDVSGTDPQTSLFDAGPMRRRLAELVDFDRLNDGQIRLSVLAIDLASGDEVIFDTTKGRIELDHLMASAALIPDFPAVELAGRLLVDGGLASNLPLHVVLEEVLDRGVTERLTCFAVDVFPVAAPLPHGVLQAAQRQSDLIFASQTRRTLSTMARLWAGREPGADLFLVAYQGLEEETAIKGFDFGTGTLARRHAAGYRDIQAQIELSRTVAATASGLSVHAADPMVAGSNRAAWPKGSGSGRRAVDQGFPLKQPN